MKLTNLILEDAIDWYIEGNSIKKIVTLISQKYGISAGKETVRRHLSSQITLRSKKEIMAMKRGTSLNEDMIVHLYESEQLSLKQIAKRFNASASGMKWVLIKNNIHLRDKREALKMRIGKYEKPKFTGTLSERAYLSGLVLGDVAVRKISNFTIEANTTTTIKNMAELLTSVFSNYTDGIRCYPDEKKGFRFCAYLDKSFNFLIEIKSNQEIIKHMNKKQFMYFLAGFVDSEGSIINRKYRKGKRWVLKIGNTNLKILEIIKQRLKEFEINSRIHLYNKKGKCHFYKGQLIINTKDYYALEVDRKIDLRLLIDLIPIKHKDKLDKKDEFLKIKNSLSLGCS